MLRLPLLRRVTSVLALAGGFYACESGPFTSSGNPPAETAAPPGPAIPDQPVRLSRYPNPVYAGDFADPFVLVADSSYYAYATNQGGRNVPTLRSFDLVTWVPVGDALPVLPSWAEGGRNLTWAPAVIAFGQRYVLFYTARDRRTELQCIGRAESDSPLGPFTDNRSSPFICQTDLGGSIDPTVVRDSDQLYLLWKNDGNCCGKPVTLWGQRLTANGRDLTGAPTPLLHRDQEWEGPLIEGPTMWRDAGVWHLLYSANMWNTDRYAVGYALCDSPLGPCRKVGQGPVLASDNVTAGPGGAEVFSDREGYYWIAYHGWSASRVGYRHGGARSLRVDRIAVSGDF